MGVVGCGGEKQGPLLPDGGCKGFTPPRRWTTFDALVLLCLVVCEFFETDAAHHVRCNTLVRGTTLPSRLIHPRQAEAVVQ
jgi:hypothetical protein